MNVPSLGYWSKEVFKALIVTSLSVPSHSVAADIKPVSPPLKSGFDLYLLIGQSNMAGRGIPEPEDQTANPRVLAFTAEGHWRLAAEPITVDPNKFHGVGPGVAFGKAMAEAQPQRSIGLIPCAVGGTPLKRWEPGADLYSNAVHQAKLAMQFGNLRGILWHQGESDSNSENAPTYATRLASMINALRNDLGAPNAPFVAGELGQFLITRTNNPNLFAKQLNEVFRDLPSRLAFTGCATSDGLRDKGDGLHFDSASQREFGKRYARQMLEIQKRLPAPDSKK